MLPNLIVRRAVASLAAVPILLLSARGRPRLTSTVPSYVADQARRYPPQKGGLTPYRTSGPRSTVILCITESGRSLLLGTSVGIFRSEDGESWQPASSGLDPSSETVYYLVAAETAIFAGTSGGLYQSRDEGNSWQRIRDVSRQEINGLVKIGTTLFVLGPDGLYRSEIIGDKDAPWKLVHTGLEGQQLDHLASVGATLYFWGPDGIYFGDKRGDSWRPMDAKVFYGPWLSLGSLAGTLVAADGPWGGGSGIYLRDGRAGRWVEAKHVDPKCAGATALDVMGDTIWTGGSYGVCRSKDVGKHWQAAVTGPRFVNTVFARDNSLLVGTANGLYVTHDQGGSWKRLRTGLYETSPQVKRVLAANGELFAATNIGVYRSNDHGASWKWVVSGLPDPEAYDLTVLNGRLFVANSMGVYYSDDGGDSWLLSSGSGVYVQHVITAGNRLLASWQSSPQQVGVYQSDNRGKSWAANGCEGPAVLALMGTESAAFASVVGNGVYRSVGGSWEAVGDGLGSQNVGALANSPDAVFAGTAQGALFKLDDSNRGASWKRLDANGLWGEVLTLWVDQRRPNVVIAGTMNGLFWSTDGGKTFTKWRGRENQPDLPVLSVTSLGRQFFIGTLAGVYYLYDDIGYISPGERLRDLIKENPKWVGGLLLVVLVSLVFSTRLVLLLLQLDLWGIRNIAPLVYLTPWGRWKLYRRYRAMVSNDTELRDHHHRYVDLPYEWHGSSAPEMGQKLSERIGQLKMGSPRLVVVAPGGRGKTTLCHYIAVRAAEGTLRLGGRRLEPVIVEGMGYTGDLLASVTSSLKRRKAYVSSTIVESQLLDRRLLVIVDGFSEIRQSFREAADSSDIPKFVKDRPDTSFVFTSRSPLPPPVRGSVGGAAFDVTLKDLDGETERVFLSQYLLNGEREVDAVLQQIKSNFPDLPLIPLLLTLIAKIYDEKKQVPKGRATLFKEYADWILRAEATDIEDPAGLKFALRHLVRETYLETGDRGLTLDQGVKALTLISDPLKQYGIDLPSLKIVNLFVRAGLYKRLDENLRFFHDSFESYYAARALESAFRNKEYAYVRPFQTNPVFAETWEFLNEILTETDEAKKLNEILTETDADRKLEKEAS